MKSFDAIAFDYEQCRQQLEQFRDLLNKNPELSEKHKILPLFRESRQLCCLFSVFNNAIWTVDRFAKEFNIFGDFACDVAVGDSARGEYCFVEFEDARKNSIFEKNGEKSTREWGKRFDHGYSQIVDWVHKLSGLAISQDNLGRFGQYEIGYETVLVIGRDGLLLKTWSSGYEGF